jgi:hypothetical protein
LRATPAGQSVVLEVKRRKRGFASFYRWLSGKIYAVLHRADNKEWLVTMRASDFIDLARKALRMEEEP